MTSPSGGTPRPTRPPKPPKPAPPPDVYSSTAEFFDQALSVWYARDPYAAASSWCPEWASHPEAYKRVEDLHMAWEDTNRAKHTAPADWWVRWADPIMRELMDPSGTFAACTRDTHNPAGVVPLPG